MLGEFCKGDWTQTFLGKYILAEVSKRHKRYLGKVEGMMGEVLVIQDWGPIWTKT